MRNCGVTDGSLALFAWGDIPGEGALEEHILGCAECQAHLDLLWSEELDRDLSIPVLRAIKLDRLVWSILSSSAAVLGRLKSAFWDYTFPDD